jgi:hypothetical protein
MRIGTLWLHWPSGTWFRLTGRNRAGLLCGIAEVGGGFVYWPARECSEVGT